MKRRTLTGFVITLGTAVLLPPHSFAGEEENALIAKMVEAYGGDALMNISSFTLQDTFTNISAGQRHGLKK